MSDQLSWSLRWRLSVMWLLEWGITGAILTYLPLYFTESGIKEHQLGLLMAVSAVGLWVAPFVVGQICDRWLATEKYLALSHFVGGLTLMSIPLATEYFDSQTGENFGGLLALLGLYACSYLPTVPLASSLTFRHLSNPDAQFGKVRIWGTVGWVSSGLFLSVWLGRSAVYEWLLDLLAGWPALSAQLVQLKAELHWLRPPVSADCFRIAALLSFALSGFCVFLPATPPQREAEGKIAPLEVLSMLRNRTSRALIGVSFALAIVVPFYALAVPQLLQRSGINSEWVPAVMTVGQISEFPALLLLHVCIRRLGMKRTFALGILAWLVRYVLFAMHVPFAILLLGVAMHGVCHVFLIIVIQLYVDTQCTADTKASAQNLFAFITMGIAMPIGFVVSGLLGDWCQLDQGAAADYRLFFGVPAVALLAILCVYHFAVRWDDDAHQNRK